MPTEQPYLNQLNAKSDQERWTLGPGLKERDRQEDKMEKKSIASYYCKASTGDIWNSSQI